MYCCVLWLDRKYCRRNCATVTLKPVHYRSSHWRCSIKKGALRSFAKFTGKHLCARPWACNFIKKETLVRERDYLHRKCCRTSFICCFIMTAENLIWPVVFLLFILTGRAIFFCSAVKLCKITKNKRLFFFLRSLLKSTKIFET